MCGTPIIVHYDLLTPPRALMPHDGSRVYVPIPSQFDPNYMSRSFFACLFLPLFVLSILPSGRQMVTVMTWLLTPLSLFARHSARSHESLLTWPLPRRPFVSTSA